MIKILRSLMLVLCSVGISYGQTFTGSLSGTVFDETKAVLGEASVTLKSVSTGFERTVQTSADGSYLISSLQPSEYIVTVRKEGFSPAEQRVQITVALQARIDFTLTIAPAKEQVDIVGESGVILNTESAERGITINERRINALPSASRNPYDFALIAPGASSSYSPLSQFFPRDVSVAVNGQRLSSGNYLLDGGQNVNTFVNTPGQLISLDAVQEYRLQTNNYSAEFGRGAGYVANVITRSGSNEFHGSVYEYLRNSRLAANTPENNAQGLTSTGQPIAPRPVFTRNQFGFSLSGPVVKDKAFFFANLEPIRVRSSAPTTFLVPTPELISISSPGTKAIFERFPIPSGLSTTNVEYRTVCPYGQSCSEGGRVTIPAYAAVTRIGPTDAGAGAPQNRYLGTFRVDYNFSDRTQLFGRYSFDKMDQFATVTQPFSPELDRSNNHGHHNMLLNLTKVITQNLVSETRLMYARVRGFNFSEAPESGDFPILFTFEDGVTLPSGTEGLFYPQNVYQISQTLGWVKGKHSLRFGGQFIQIRDNYTDTFLKTGLMAIPFTQNLVSGNVSQYRIGVDPKGRAVNELVPPPFNSPSFTRHFRTNQYALFVHDTWRVHKRVTLGFGLRYENFGVLSSIEQEKHLESNFAWGEGSNIYERIANGSFVRTIDLPGDLKGRLHRPDNNNFAPRASVAWDIRGDGKIIFRSGAGIFYDAVYTQPSIYTYLNPPAFSTTTLRGLQLTPELLRNPFSVFPNAPIRLNASQGRFIDPDLKSAYVASWNAALESQFMKNIVASVAYVGSSGVGLYTNHDINRLGSGRFLGRPGERLNTNMSGLQIRSNQGHSSYHGLQLSAESKVLPSLGLQFGANYTWSHSIDNSSSIGGFDEDSLENGLRLDFIDAFNPSLDKASSAFDIRHRFVANFVWELPFGKTGSSLNRYLLGGWGVSGIMEYQTGQPFTLIDSNAPNFGSDQARPTFIGGQLPSYTLTPTPNRPNTFLYLPINPVYDETGECVRTGGPIGCAPDVNGPFIGTLGRNLFRRPGTRREDIALFKRTRLPWREGMSLELRAEFYNAFNHPNLVLKPGTQDIGIGSGVMVTKSGSRQIILGAKFNF
jgi:hypothetical protein